ncbi:tRNA 5-hydroxyuridine modification protein YegQ [Sulfurivermis fontis]|uniref:prephenate-dependent tRNA uridine(34) hydroxylase TrhP n=1 Tax=Sulfurivermis fontis TaxID=1972068 RepID=UPI000FD99010|nr:tRNA 5-hydroxyuridine modification protein YegQ [Sulfurivermis fontis]
MKTPELLAPAGSLRHLRVAYAYGADAVYAGLPRYSLRVRNNDFDLEKLGIGIEEAHAQGRQFFLASNVMPHNAKVKTFLADMAPVIALKPDALIMADPGLILMVRERWPEMPVHLSVQANTVNYADVRFWQRQGIARVILSRELSLEEVAEIRQKCPDMELEVFVHGALCIAYSGRCLLSGYFNHRDPNQGTCTNSCRWDYQVHQTVTDASGDVRRAEAQQVYLLEQREHPGELMPIEEDEHGTYIMNSKDLRAVEHIAELVRIGVDSLKIEGRTKSPYYIARTTQAYRQAIDDAVAGRPFDTRLLAELENLANRGYTDGFYVRHHTQDYQNYIKGASSGERQQFVGEVDGYDAATGLAEIAVKNKVRVGDRLELITPQGNRRFVLERMEGCNGAALDEAPGGGHRVRIPLPAEDYRYALLAKEL